MSLRTNLVVMLASASLACGDGGGDQPGRTATATATATAEPEQDGGDEGGNRVELDFDVRARSIRPARVEVPAFLGLRIRVRNRSGELRVVALDGAPHARIAPERTETFDAEGLQPGRHELAVGTFRATIVAVRAGG